MKQNHIILIGVALIVFLSACDFSQHTLVLGDVTWEYHGRERSESTLKINNKPVLVRRNISLWGQYPYIVGDCVMPGVIIFYFVIDIRTKEIKYFDKFRTIRENYKINFDFRNFVTFQDLHGQWSKPEKVKELREKLKKQ